jgi:hypothetical protein
MNEKLPPIYVNLPSQHPMTEEQIVDVSREAVKKLGRSGGNMYIIIARAIEKHHGITGRPPKGPIKFSD